MAGTMEDRWNERLPKSGKVAIKYKRGLIKRTAMGDVLDVSAGGFKACVDKPIKVGRRVAVDANIQTGTEKRHFKLKGVVRRSNLDRISKKCTLGIELRAKPRKQKKAWEDSIFETLRLRKSV